MYNRNNHYNSKHLKPANDGMLWNPFQSDFDEKTPAEGRMQKKGISDNAQSE